MSEEADKGAKSVVVEDEHRSDGGVSLKVRKGGPVSGCSPVRDHSAVLTTGNELPGWFDPE